MAALHLYLVLWLCLWSTNELVSAEPVVLIVTPKHVRFGQPAPVLCSANGVSSGGNTVRLTLIDSSDSYGEPPIFEETLHFIKDGVQNVTFTVTPDDVRPTSTSLTLTISGPEHRSEEIEIKRDAGYILVQTDKPVYTPRQTVKYRVVAVDEEQRWAPWSVHLEVVSPNGIIVDRIQNLDSFAAFDIREYHLHEHCMLGKWKIEASFKEEVQLSTKNVAEFEVKEYVLPKFSAELEVAPDIITMATKEITVNMTAEYVFGAGIAGEAVLRIGVKKGNKFLATDRLYHAQFASGKAVISINTSDLSGLSVWFPEEASRLYVEANVTDDGYGDVVTISNYITPISRSTYTINIDTDSMYFLPGKPFIMKGRLTKPSGDGARKVSIFVTRKGQLADHLMISERLQTKVDGEFRIKVTNLPDVPSIQFQIQTKDRQAQTQTTKTLLAYALPQSHIILQSDQKVKSGIAINVGYASTPDDSHMTVLVESRGRVVHAENFKMTGRDMRTIKIPEALLKELSPFASVTAFFSRRQSTSTLVMKTITIDVPDICQEELSLKASSNNVKLPGARPRFRLEGTNNTRVSLVAVDKSVYLISGRKTISRSSLFDYLGSHSLGSKSDSKYGITGIKTWQGNGFLLSLLEEPPLLYFPDIPTHKGKHWNTGRPGPEGIKTGVALKPTLDFRDPVPTEENEFDIPARSFFPETWLFEDILLSRKRGRSKTTTKHLRYKLPDSLTTWSVQAVGVSSRRGICVSNSIDFVVRIPFFVDLQLPYKVVRLESATLKLAIFNYLPTQLKVKVWLTVPEELCLVKTKSKVKRGSRRIVFERILQPNQRDWKKYVVVPLKAGQYNISVKARGIYKVSQEDQASKVTDRIIRSIYIVPEGQPVSKTVTFQLDPSALLSHNTSDSRDNMANAHQGETIKNTWDRLRSEQTTIVDMALPTETIPGTSYSNIYAYGDLLSDVVHSVLIESQSLMGESESVGRKVLGELAPVIHTLVYLHTMELLTPDLQDKGKQFVKEGVSQLLSYRNEDGSFSYLQDKPPSTWFTAAVLHTLCTVQDMEWSFVDTRLIDEGAEWLLGQIGDDGEIYESENRRKGISDRDAAIIVASETLLFILQCEGHLSAGEVEEYLKYQVLTYLEDNMENITSSLALAKSSLALHLADSEYKDVAVKNLIENKRNTSDGIFWSDKDPDESGPRSVLHQGQADALSVEATSFALMTLLESRSLDDVRSVAVWLVQQRGKYGAFVGAMDTSAATQALARYSLERQTVDSDLHCNITSHQSDTYLQTVDFSQQEAIVKKGVSGVPTGEIYQFDSRGSRLGQMQIETEFNVAVGKNDHCPFNLTVTRLRFAQRSSFSNDQLTPLCRHCNLGCPEGIGEHHGRSKRTVSSSILCIKVCLSPLNNRTHHNVRVDTGLLSGYEALRVTEDEMRLMTGGRANSHRHKNGVFTVELREVPPRGTTCFGLHAKDQSEVEYQQPAVVTVKEEDKREVSCSVTYDVSDSSVTLPVFCSNKTRRRKGVCMCTSGACGKCYPGGGKKILTKNIKSMLCHVDFVYKLKTSRKRKEGAWIYQPSEILDIKKSGRDKVVKGQSLSFSTPKYCNSCPNYKTGHFVYAMGKNAERLMDTDGTETYVIDESTVFINVSAVKGVPEDRAAREYDVKRAIREGCRERK